MRVSRLASAFVFVLCVVPAAAQDRFAAGDVLVGPRAQRGAAVRALVQRLGVEIAERDAISGVLRVRVPVGEEDAWVARLAAAEDVAYAERNGLGGGGLVPNDTHFGVQWHLQNTGQSGGLAGADIDATSAWNVTTGAPSTVIAVLDTGIDFAHPEFAGRIDPDGYDFVNEDANPQSDHPHGSRVAGVMCANADNGFGVSGVDWQCKVLPIKVLDQFNAGTVMDLAQGLNYVATQNDVQVVSMSLINYPGNQTLINALQAASSAGKILIACAGNGGMGNANTSYPGASPLTISIGATTRHDTRATFSATGAPLDFVAPGLDIATVVDGSTADQFVLASGCSFATPMTAGVVGLLLARAQALGYPPLSQADVYELLRRGAADQVGPPSEDPPGRDDNFGHGRIDGFASLQAIPGLLCQHGGVGMGLGGPFDVVRINGASSTGSERTVVVPSNAPFALQVDVPPSNPQPSSVPPFFVLWANAAPAAGPATPLPLGIGSLCFDPHGANTFVSLGATAPWSTTVPALAAPLVVGIQGAIFDTPLGHIAITNLVRFSVENVPPPVILGVTPRAAAVGSTVTVSGSGFLPGLVLRVNGVAVPPLSVAPTSVTFAAPAGMPCDTNVGITNPDQQSASSPFNVSPVLTTVFAPNGTPAAGGTLLLLVGQNFVAGSTVTIGGNPLTIGSISATAISGTLPPGVVGPASIVVTTPFACTATGSLTYTP